MKQHKHYQKDLSTAVQNNLLKSRGDTLIEVLITFFVIAVGILGASSMQIVALQNVNGASTRDQAVIIAENLAESMRASPAPYVNLITAAQADANNLPSGSLQAPQTNPGEFTITIRWDEDRDGDAGTNCPISSSADLDCYQIILTP